MHAVLAQLSAENGDVEANARRAAEVVERHAEADIVVFPELFLSGYDLRVVAATALRADAEPLRRVAEAARAASVAVAIGFVEQGRAGPANAVALFDRDGSPAGVYRKVQLYGAEREVFVPGSELLVAALAGRRVGVLVCFDVEFPELARELALAGADLLVTCSANMEPYYGAHELATRARALENELPHLYVNLVGWTRSLRFVGGSRSVAPDGAVLAEAGHAGEEVVRAPVAEPVDPARALGYLSQLPPRPRVAAA